MININNLNIEKDSFKLTVDNIHFSEGTLNLIIGRNNSGKSLLLKTIANAYANNTSTIETSERVIYVGPDNLIPGTWLVGDVGSIIRGIDASFDHIYFNHLIYNTFNLFQIKRVDDLSLGQSKLFQLALALAFKPKILLLDDISNGLDQKHKILLIEILQNLVIENNTCVVVCSNLIEDFELVADHFFGIKDNKLNYLGTSDSLQDTYRLWLGSYEEYLSLDPSVVESYAHQRDNIKALVKGDVANSHPSSLLQILLLLGRGHDGTDT